MAFDDQAVSYARLLTPIAPFALVFNGTAGGTKVYDVFSKDLLTDGLPSREQAVKRATKVAPTADQLDRFRCQLRFPRFTQRQCEARVDDRPG